MKKNKSLLFEVCNWSLQDLREKVKMKESKSLLIKVGNELAKPERNYNEEKINLSFSRFAMN